MKYCELVEVFEKLEKISGRLEMTDIVADFISNANLDEDETFQVIYFLQGIVFPAWNEKELGVAANTVITAISKISGWKEDKIKDAVRDCGDLGDAAEKILGEKMQQSLFTEPLTVRKVYNTLIRISECSGKGAVERKISLLGGILSFAQPKEAKYIIRTILEELRIGVGEGVLRDAISKVYKISPEVIENAYNIIGDFGEIIQHIKKGDIENIEIKVGRPIKLMLAEKAESIKEVLGEGNSIKAFEIKYDGMRVQIHKNNNEIKLFTRRLDDVTTQFPEIVEMTKKNLNAISAIVEGEVVAIDENRHPMPFQNLSMRIKRKYHIKEMTEKIPVEINLFDVIYLNNKTLIKKTFMERREILEKIVNQTKKFRLAEQILTNNEQEAEKFYQKALSMGHEGVMIKNPEAPYQPGLRVGYMYKIKPVMETLDLIITGATWGEGRRAHWLASFLLGVRDAETGKILEIGRMATGLTDNQFKEMTETLKPLITEEIGQEVKIKPKVVVEVAYEEIQKSPSYSSGYALRFPRLVRVREDKGIKDADTTERIKHLIKEK